MPPAKTNATTTANVTPTKRTSRHPGRRTSATSAAIQNTASTGPTSSTSMGHMSTRTSSALFSASAAERDADQNDHDEQLVERARTDHGARDEPPPRIAPPNRADRAQQCRGPHHEIQTRRQQHVPEHEGEGRSRDAPRRERLRAAVAAHLARHEREQQHRDDRAHQRHDAQRRDAVAEQRDRRVRDRGRERRLVGVAPLQRQHPEVQLVAVIAVVRREHAENERERPPSPRGPAPSRKPGSRVRSPPS